jgi:cellulose biosynthesis protein BcsQ
MKTINFYSYKGGVGRTMLTVQIARLLAALGKKVVVADFDFDAPGIPAVFNKGFKDIESGGIFELFTAFKRDSGPTKAFEDSLDKYLVKIDIELKGNRAEKEGSIQILPSGRISDEYWNEISKTSWLEALSAPKQKPSSFLRFVLKTLKPSLEAKGIDYFLIDARAGVTYYGNIGQYVADYQAMVFCPNKEAMDALETFLLPALEKSHEKRLEAFNKDKECGIDSYELPLKRVVFIVSRIPPELVEKRDTVFETMEKLITNKLSKRFMEYTNTKIFKLHSDLNVHLDSRCRDFDGRYLNKELGEDIVQIHEDILKILVVLCPEVCECKLIVNDDEELLREQAHSLWEKIYNYEFRITYENRLFGFLSSGEIQNPDDKKRNVAFKVVTFLGFLNNFYDTLVNRYVGKDLKSREVEATEVMRKALSSAGSQCGEAFGEALSNQWKNNGEKYTSEKKIDLWCDFDTRAGFGLMSYDKNEKVLEVKNPFIVDVVATNGRDYSAFFDGYVHGVLAKLLETAVEIGDVFKNENNVIKYKIVMEG